MEIRSTKFMNINILKSLVITCIMLGIIGVIISYVNITDPYNEIVKPLVGKYFYVSLVLLALVYIAQVFWLQKPGDENPSNGKFYLNIFLLVAAILILFRLNSGTIGVMEDRNMFVDPMDMLSSTDPGYSEVYIIISSILIAAVIIISMIAVIMKSNYIILIQVILIAAYTIVFSSYILSVDIMLLYVFGLYTETRNTDRRPEILFIAVASLVSFISILSMAVPVIIDSMSVYGSLFDTGNIYSFLFHLLSLVYGILFIFAWKKSCLKLLIIGGVLYLIEFISFFVVSVLSAWTYMNEGVSVVSAFMSILDGYEMGVSVILIFFVISLVGLVRNRKKGSIKINESANDKRIDRKLVIAIVISAMAFIVITCNSIYSYIVIMKDFHEESDSGIITENEIIDEMPVEDETIYLD